MLTDSHVPCVIDTAGFPLHDNLNPGLKTHKTSCGEISVNPGDIILGDPDGVVVIPRNDAPQILKDAQKFQEADEKKLIAVREGTSNRDWVDKALLDHGFEFIDAAYEA